jgi:hypothetical protein
MRRRVHHALRRRGRSFCDRMILSERFATFRDHALYAGINRYDRLRLRLMSSGQRCPTSRL